jgi:two-component system NtrC family sensor kinase
VEASARLAQVLENLERFTRVDRASYQEIDLNEGIESVLVLLEPHLPDGLDVVRNYGELPPVRAHPAELNQVFMTLLRNASEAIDGEGTITVGTRAEGRNVYVRIADTGRGIPEDRLSTLFDLGFSTKGARVEMRIGLVTAHDIVHSHEGDIRVKSAEGEGTEFTIRLPVRPARASTREGRPPDVPGA